MHRLAPVVRRLAIAFACGAGLAACGGGFDEAFRCGLLPCTPSYSVDSDDLAVRVLLTSDGRVVSGRAELDTGDDLDLPVILDDENLLLRQGGLQVEFRAEDDDTVHYTRGTLPSHPGERYTLRFERRHRTLEGDVVLPQVTEVLAPAAGSLIAAAPARVPLETDLPTSTNLVVVADLNCTMADGSRPRTRRLDVAADPTQTTAEGSLRPLDVNGTIQAYERELGQAATSCDVGLVLVTVSDGRMPSALDGRSSLQAQVHRPLALRYLAPTP